MRTDDDDDDDAAEDHRREQQAVRAAYSAKNHPPRPKDGKVPRYFKGLDCPDSLTADVFYIDRTTGKEVMRYDGADPANTNPYYGAEPDGDCMAKRGMDINEMIDPKVAVITDDALRALCRVNNDDEEFDY